MNPIPTVENFPMIDPILMADSILMRYPLPMLEFILISAIHLIH